MCSGLCGVFHLRSLVCVTGQGGTDGSAEAMSSAKMDDGGL